jgi:sugar phosphate isomerase/epimerase
MGHIRIGNQTSFSALSLRVPFDFALAHDFDAFEWFPDRNKVGMGWSEADLTREQRAIIRRTALAHDISLSVHAPWWANPLDPEALDLLFKNIDLARDLGASLFNIHLYHDQGIPPYVRAIAPLIDRLASVHIKLSIENTPLTGPGDFEKLFSELVKDGLAGAEQVGMCLDLGHANLCDATRNDYLKFIDQLVPDVPIIHVHLHENYGDRDSHLTIFSGPADRDPSGIRGFLERMHRRRFSGCIILEQWPEPPTLLLNARNRLTEMIGKVQEFTSQP